MKSVNELNSHMRCLTFLSRHLGHVGWAATSPESMMIVGTQRSPRNDGLFFPYALHILLKDIVY